MTMEEPRARSPLSIFEPGWDAKASQPVLFLETESQVSPTFATERQKI
jgi:hypothetical protein